MDVFEGAARLVAKLLPREGFLTTSTTKTDSDNDLHREATGFITTWSYETSRQGMGYLMAPPRTCNISLPSGVVLSGALADDILDELGNKGTGYDDNDDRHETLLHSDPHLAPKEVDNAFQKPAIVTDAAAASPPSVGRNLMTEWRFQIVYSETWQAPVLYFTVQTLQGSPCPRFVVLNYLLALQQDNDEGIVKERINSDEDKLWEFVSVEEHPLHGIPSFFLHPCRSRDRLQMLQGLNTNATTLSCAKGDPVHHAAQELLSWMSMVLPTVGIQVPSSFFQQMIQLINADTSCEKHRVDSIGN